jgi:hypothetical protein
MARRQPHQGPLWLWPVILVALAAVADWLTVWFVKAEMQRKGYAHLDMRVAGFDVILTLVAVIACWIWWHEWRARRRIRKERNGHECAETTDYSCADCKQPQFWMRDPPSNLAAQRICDEGALRSGVACPVCATQRFPASCEETTYETPEGTCQVRVTNESGVGFSFGNSAGSKSGGGETGLA